jgi:hypothetical protein
MIRCYRRCTAALVLLLLALAPIATQAQTTVPGWRRHTPLPLPLAGHATALLPSGDILVAGGLGGDGVATRTSILYHPATGTFTPTLNQLSNARANHALVAVEVAGGVRVFAIGGYNGVAGEYRGEATVEELDVDASGNGRWRVIGSLCEARGDLRATYDGVASIVVSGGRTGSGALHAGPPSAAADRIDVAASTVVAIEPMTSARAEHVTARFRAEDRSLGVLVAGGEGAAASTEIVAGSAWDPIANPPVARRSAAVGIGDPAGIARAFGGFDASGSALATCEWYDVKSGWRAAPRMNEPRARFDATLVAGPNDSARAYNAIGGAGVAGALASSEIFELPDAASPNGVWTMFARMIDAASERRVAISGANLPLVVGGRLAGGSATAGTEIYQPLRAGDVHFGLEEIGRRSDSQLVVVENTWLLPVRVERFRIDGGEFLVRGDTSAFVLAPGARRSLRVYFQPSSPGIRSGRLLFDIGALTDTVTLVGRAVASELALITSPIDFGSRLIGTRNVVCRHVLRNDGTEPATIDSIVVEPQGAFRLVSPLGRTTIAPGDSLEICLEFAPRAQGIATADASLHIGARRIAVQTLGRGARRYGIASALASNCDTVSAATGAEGVGTIRLDNRGDTALTIGTPSLAASADGLFRLSDPARFPMTLAPGESATVDVIFSPVRESRESVTLTFPNDGDTTITASLCFVARARTLAVSQPAIDFGELCPGDSVSALVTVENPSGYDRVELLGLDVGATSDISVDGFTPRTLGPREYITLSVGFRAATTGARSAALTIRSDRGDVVVPVTATVLRGAGFRADALPLVIGDTTIVAVRAEGIDPSAPVRRARVVMTYDARAVLPLRLVGLGAAQLDASSRIVPMGGGRAALEIAWRDSGIAGDGAVFGVVVETLRSDVDSASIALEGAPADGYCMRSIETRVDVRGRCRGNAGRIRTGEARFIAARPIPTSTILAVTVVADEGETIALDVVDQLGRTVIGATTSITTGRSSIARIDVAGLAAGAYLLRARSDDGIVGTQQIVVTR